MVKSARPDRSPAQLIGLMDSLCDPVRLRLVRLIERHELGVAELCDIVQLPQSTVSRHLKLLADQGWTLCRRNGTTNLYRMAGDELKGPARKLWSIAREQIADSSAVKHDQLRLQRRLQQRHRNTQSFFAGAAGRWDKLRRELYGPTFTHAALLALLPSDWTVADLGCGSGAMLSELAPYVAAVIGVDQSKAMLNAAAKRTAGFENVELRRGDLEALPLARRQVDAVIVSIVLTYVAAPDVVLREAARVTRSGGQIVVVDLLRHEREDFRRQMGQQGLGFETDELAGLLADAGWTDPRCRTLPPEPGVKGPALLLATAKRKV